LMGNNKAIISHYEPDNRYDSLEAIVFYNKQGIMFRSIL